MNYVVFEAGNKEYKLRLSTRAVIDLEKRLGCNPLAIFGDGTTIPTITTLVNVLHASLSQLNHGITVDGAYDIFDAYLADGHIVTDFLPVLLELYKVSGLIKMPEKSEEVKNA